MAYFFVELTLDIVAFLFVMSLISVLLRLGAYPYLTSFAGVS